MYHVLQQICQWMGFPLSKWTYLHPLLSPCAWSLQQVAMWTILSEGSVSCISLAAPQRLRQFKPLFWKQAWNWDWAAHPHTQDLRTKSSVHYCISYWHTIASMWSPPHRFLPPTHPSLTYRFTAFWASILLPARNVMPPKMAKYFRVWNMLSWVQ